MGGCCQGFQTAFHPILLFDSYLAGGLLRCRICVSPLELLCPGVLTVQRNLRGLSVEAIKGKNSITFGGKRLSLELNMTSILVSLKANTSQGFPTQR